MTRPLRRLLTVAGLTVAAPVLALGLSSSPASAALSGVAVDDDTPTDGQLVFVDGFATPGATVSVGECDLDTTVVGTDCNQTDTDRYARVVADASTGYFWAEIVVDDEFDNESFIPFLSPETPDSDCADSPGSDQCGIAVQEYAGNTPTDLEVVALTF